MTQSATAIGILSERLCPWLEKPWGTLIQAHRDQRLGHAWLLAGQEGIGKTNLALAFGRELLSGAFAGALPPNLGPKEALTAMRDRHVPADHHPDLHCVFPEEGKRSIGIEQIRAVSEAFSLKSFNSGIKLAIVEPAEAMTLAAANALLKTLEEPSGDSYLLLVSHQPGLLPSTIRSRCQTLAIRGPKIEALAGWLGIEAAGLSSGDADRWSPFQLAEKHNNNGFNFNEIESVLDLIYKNKSDPQQLADEWQKKDLTLFLDWLIARLQAAIRARFLARQAQQPTENSFTDLSGGSTDNIWQTLGLAALFKQLAAAEKLRARAGRGINEDLALRVLLQGFAPDWG